MNEKATDVYFSLDQNRLSFGVFQKINKRLIFSDAENISFVSIYEDTDFNFLKKPLEKNIKKIEKKTNSFVNNICLMVETNRSISICISLMKNLDNKKIQNKDIKYLIQDAKQQILRAYPNNSIVHIIVKKYMINDLEYNFAPSNIVCEKISLDIEFICLPKNLIKRLESLFRGFEITIDKFICAIYANSFASKLEGQSICQIGYNLSNGFNKQEVVLIPKKIEKTGFFEKLFHFFK